MSNPAEIASEKALEELYDAINKKQCFRLEAGAGAGKTYSLIKALQYLLKEEASILLRKNQKIACITYTNVAKNEINSRTDNHPAIFADTIHGFSWGIIQGMQKQMREFIPSISAKWKKRIDEAGGLKNQTIVYDLGYPSANENEITLHHDDVIKLFAHLLSVPKFRNILKSKFPIIFIDEYQDTNKGLAESIVQNIIENDTDILIGFFGDHWQKIYGSKACGLIQASEGKILEIGKNANFRSDKNIVEMLSRMRPELPQNVSDPDSHGDIDIYLTNTWNGVRRTDNHWQGDLPPKDAHESLQTVLSELENKGWDLSPEKTKILMLTNNVLAEEQGYLGIASIFSDTDDYLKKNDHYIKFLIDIVENVCHFFQEKKYGEMFKSIGIITPRLKKQKDKTLWNNHLNTLNNLRKNGTIGEVLELLKKTKRPRLSSKVEQYEKRYEKFAQLPKEEQEEEKSFYNRVTALKTLKYREIIELSKYLDNKTPFSTKHGVKGAEFENVLVVCGRGWNNYNWNQYLTWVNNDTPNDREAAYERNRNLFYVACSRPKNRLCILFTQELEQSSIETLKKWFLDANIKEVEF